MPPLEKLVDALEGISERDRPSNFAPNSAAARGAASAAHYLRHARCISTGDPRARRSRSPHPT